jgi:hypothetical protein
MQERKPAGPTKRERYRATIFGSARAKPGTFAYDEVKRLAAALAEPDVGVFGLVRISLLASPP